MLSSQWPSKSKNWIGANKFANRNSYNNLCHYWRWFNFAVAGQNKDLCMPYICGALLLDSRQDGSQLWNDYKLQLRAHLHIKLVNNWEQCLPTSQCLCASNLHWKRLRNYTAKWWRMLYFQRTLFSPKQREVGIVGGWEFLENLISGGFK